MNVQIPWEAIGLGIQWLERNTLVMDNVMPSGDEQFERFFEGCVQKAKEIFERDGTHAFIVSLFCTNGKMIAVPAGGLMQALEKFGTVVAKEGTWLLLQSVAAASNCIGYLIASEAWAIDSTSFDGAESYEQAYQTYERMIEKYGSIEKVPGRMELLSVTGRFKHIRKNAAWKVRRLADHTILEPCAPATHQICPRLDRIIDTFLKSE